MGDAGMMRAADANRFLLLPMPQSPDGHSVPRFAVDYVGLFAGHDVLPGGVGPAGRE